MSVWTRLLEGETRCKTCGFIDLSLKEDEALMQLQAAWDKSKVFGTLAGAKLNETKVKMMASTATMEKKDECTIRWCSVEVCGRIHPRRWCFDEWESKIQTQGCALGSPTRRQVSQGGVQSSVLPLQFRGEEQSVGHLRDAGADVGPGTVEDDRDDYARHGKESEHGLAPEQMDEEVTRDRLHSVCTRSPGPSDHGL